MKYLSVKEAAVNWGISERTVRSYCQQGRVEGAYRSGKFWKIPQDATKPHKVRKLSEILKMEKQSGYSGGIYHRILVDFTYHSNRIEGNGLTHDQIWSILDTNSIEAAGNQVISVDDVLETNVIKLSFRSFLLLFLVYVK